MSLQNHFYALEPQEKFDLAVCASNTTLRKILMQQIATLKDELTELDIPTDVAVRAQEFTLRYGNMRKQLLAAQELVQVLEESLEFLHQHRKNGV